MIIKISNINKDIEKNGWKEVKVSNYFIPNTSENHPDGLISNEIFGLPGTEARKNRWGWINLNSKFMNPHVFYVFSRLKANYAKDIKCGLGNYYVNKDGELTKLENNQTVPETALYKKTGSGFEWFYNAWPYISWKVVKGMSKIAKIRRNFLRSLDRDVAFIDKYPVMPAFYRDVDYKNQKRNEINTNFYSKMIYLAGIIKNTDTLLFAEFDDMPKVSNAHIRMQDLIQEIYLFFINKIGGANGFIHDYVIGKATDYGARLVISTPNYNTSRFNECETSFFKSSVPLSIAINTFSPFIVHQLVNFIQNYVGGERSIKYYDFSTKQYKMADLDPAFMDEFTIEKIKKYLDRYKESKYFRIETVTLRGVEGFRIPVQGEFIYESEETKELFNAIYRTSLKGEFNPEIYEKHMEHTKIENFTWCSLFYILAFKKLSDKCIYNTRYPVMDYNGTYSSTQNIIPSNDYCKVIYDKQMFSRFPKLKTSTKEEIEYNFTDTMRMFSVYPSALGADFDGDQISNQSVMSDEANIDAKKHMREISNVVGIDGSIFRELPQVVKHGLYGLTYKIQIPEKRS